ncbi:MAG: helix-turn-helix transcriptional regulator [Pseudomonadota bacterium]
MNTRLAELGAVLRRLRLERGWTLMDVAHAVDSDAGNISRLERGQQGYSPEMLGALADLFGVHLWELFKEAEGQHGPQVREDHAGYGAAQAESLRRLTQRYVQSTPAVRELVDTLVRLSASGKLPDEVCHSLLTLLGGAAKKTTAKKSKQKE